MLSVFYSAVVTMKHQTERVFVILYLAVAIRTLQILLCVLFFFPHTNIHTLITFTRTYTHIHLEPTVCSLDSSCAPTPFVYQPFWFLTCLIVVCFYFC